MLALIVLTGAAVRLTDSGLGCEDWPTCNDEQLVPANSLHGWIEFGNRLLSGVVGLAVALAALGARRLVPHRPELMPWAWGLVTGVVAQIILGAFTVKLELNPLVVAAHFLLSMVLLWNALVLYGLTHDTAPPVDTARPGSTAPPADSARPTGIDAGTFRSNRSLLAHSRLQVGMGALLLFMGTLVTGTGPNSGDIRADRFRLDLENVARLHGLTAWLFVAALVGLVLRLHRVNHSALGRAEVVVAVSVAQGALGYWQYAIGVPPILVQAHVVGAVAMWCSLVWLHIGVAGNATTETTAVADEVAPTIGQT
ncbi:MAG: cytochrome c oxidase assembly protein subunit 15 [Acidimicrobiales bacterium]|jgi:heme a synthase